MLTTSSRTVGHLYIIATPIGNRDDISARAINILQSVDKILVEDTRHSGPLLSFLGIKKPLIALHAHNENNKSNAIIQELQQGLSFALISDAGTPLISDPGYPLVHMARQAGIAVTPIPGACAITTALSAAGIPCDTFTFVGFLPAKTTARQAKLKHLLTLNHTLVFYESTHRIMDCINDIEIVFGQHCQLVLAKELTKTFEAFIAGTGETLKHWLLADQHHIKGEFVLMIPPRAEDLTQEEQEQRRVLHLLLAELPLKKAVTLAANLTGGHKNMLYKMALELEKD